MFCKKCGKQLSDGARFCPACGTQQSQLQPQTNYSTQPQTGYSPPPQTNYGPPQGYQQPQPNYGAPQPMYDAPPQYDHRSPARSYSGGTSDNAKNLLLLTVILVTVGLLAAGIFKGTICNIEHRSYKNRRSSDSYSKYYESMTMDNFYFAIIKDEGFDDFADYLDGDTKGMQLATAYTALAVGAAMAVLILISAVLGLTGQSRTAAKLAALSAFLSALPHIMFMALTFYLKSKDYVGISLSFVPIAMIAAAVFIGIFCVVAANSMKQTSASPAGNSWR